MLSRLPPLTLLLLTLAACALLASLVTITGVGGRYSLHPEDPALVPPLPDSGAAREQRDFDYTALSEASERPLFSVDRRPAPVRLDDADEVDAGLELVVTSIIMTPQLQAALVRRAGSDTTQRVKVGEDVPGSPGWRLLELQPRVAVFDGPEGRVDLDLRVFDGQGGEAPTRVVQVRREEEAATGRRATLEQRAREAQARARREGDGADDEAMQASADGSAGEAADAAEASEGRRDAPRQEMTPEEQAQAIRRRIEERREQLRQRAQRQTDEIE